MSGLAFASSQVRLVSVQREAVRRRTIGARRAVTRSFSGRPQCREASATFAGSTRKLLCQASKDSRTAATKDAAPREVSESSSWNPLLASTALWLLSESAAHAEGAEPGYSLASYSVSLGLFVMTVPGLWSLIKRAPKAAIKSRVYAVDGPAKPDAVPIDDRARQIFAYFKKYNYSVVDTGEVITFEGRYASNKGQAASLVFYTFVSLLCCGLVLTIVAPWGGNWWYGLSALSPMAGAYYMDRGERVEQVKVKMVTSDDDTEIDITIQGDPEELDRLSKELGLMERGKVYVKGLLEQ